MNAESVKVLGEIKFPQLVCPRTQKRWCISVKSNQDTVTHFNGSEWRKKHGSLSEAIRSCREKWDAKRKLRYRLLAPAFPLNDPPKTAQLEPTDIKGCDFPVSLHPLIRGQINTRGDLTTCNVMWHDAQTEITTPEGGPLILQNDGSFHIQMYESLLFMSRAFPHWIWFFVIKSPCEAVVVNAVEKNNFDAPWSYRRHMIEVATQNNAFISSTVSVVVEEDTLNDNLQFYKTTPNVLGVEVLGLKRNFTNEYVGRISFQKLIR